MTYDITDVAPEHKAAFALPRATGQISQVQILHASPALRMHRRR
jgi:hypothetical protein